MSYYCKLDQMKNIDEEILALRGEIDGKYLSILRDENFLPVLTILTNSEIDSGTESYIKSLAKFAETLSVRVVHNICCNPTQALNAIDNPSPDCYGILYMCEYGEPYDSLLKEKIPTSLDIDCVSSAAYGKFVKNMSEELVGPSTACAVRMLINHIVKKYSNRDDAKCDMSVQIFGRSERVGLPLAEMLIHDNYATKCFGSRTIHSSYDCPDFIITATNKPNQFEEDDLGVSSFDYKAQCIIDVGCEYDEEKHKLAGNVDRSTLREGLKINSVLGGIGPLTSYITLAKVRQNYARIQKEKFLCAVSQ